MGHLTRLSLVVVRVIPLLPLVGVMSGARLNAWYGVPIGDPMSCSRFP
jgi:hypothetical protein